MTDEKIRIAVEVLRELYAYESGKVNPDPVQVKSIGNTIDQLCAIHRIWF